MVRSPVSPRPLIYAHRGDRTRAEDNTLEAFAFAVEAGADGIELDVRQTMDEILVLSHDPQLEGLPPLSSMNFDDLRTARQDVPTLEETLEQIPAHVFVNVEIKNIPGQPGFDASRDIVERTIDEIRNHDDPGRILLSSFDAGAVERSKATDPGVLAGLLVVDSFTMVDSVQIATEIGADAIHPPMSIVAREGPDSVILAHAGGFAVVVWDANTPGAVDRAIRSGADVVITDDPAMGRSVASQR